MPTIPLHPAMVHLPLGLALVLPFIALFVAAGMWRGASGLRSWLGVVALQALLVGSALGAVRTGEEEEGRLAHLLPHDVLHEHEEAGEAFLYVGAGVLVLCIAAALFARRPRTMRWLATISGAAMIATAALGVYAGKLGGELVWVYGAANAGPEQPGPGD